MACQAVAADAMGLGWDEGERLSVVGTRLSGSGGRLGLVPLG